MCRETDNRILDNTSKYCKCSKGFIEIDFKCEGYLFLILL